MLTSSGRRLRASVVVISWTSYGSSAGFSLMLLVYVMYVAFLAWTGACIHLEFSHEYFSRPVGLSLRAARVVQVMALGDRDHHGHQPHPRMILSDRARSLVHWCDGAAEQDQEAAFQGQDRGEKIGTATRRTGS